MTETTRSEDTVEAYLERVRQAWDAGDASAYAREFAEDATYVIFLGDPLLGRAEIERTHVPVFQKWQKGTRMVVKPIAIRQVNAEALTVLTVGGIGKGRDIPFDKLQTYTLARRHGRWVCTAFQNTSMSRSSLRAYRPPESGGVLATLRHMFG